jgi:hypothetical protein
VAGNVSRPWLDRVHATAQAANIDAADLVDTILRRQFILHEARWEECLAAAVRNVEDEINHRRAILEQQYTGARYDKNLDLLDIKKLARAEIKRLGCAASLRTSRHPDKLSVDIRQGTEALLTDDGKVSEYGERVAAQVADFLKEYNYDRGDYWTDYTCVHFHVTVTIMDLPTERYCG